ncbi:hypothetical protein [Reyranella sp.]|uniref:hypothetical protein n=1 Tax=Reyranella sp. TaxID=1929291 RepID=UPI0011F6945D|nr:hypothetical protein [Reyranella sp.]TAJ89827.1 MAG: hypothetical protein EPO50_05555 [Reyranella sp.]
MILGAAACGPPGSWQRADTGSAATAADWTQCKQAAKEEADRLYVFSFPFPYPPSWAGRQPSYLEWQQRFAAFKSQEESRLADTCMREKGYARTAS